MDRITLMCCTNMDGSTKRLLLVFVKSRNPCCFPKDHSKLPVVYRNSMNALMTAALFKEWLRIWNNELRRVDLQICLLVNYDSNTETLSHIVIKLLPPNIMSVMQPMDMGLTNNFKGHYRSHLNSRVIAM